jgi:hypothetical protein
MNLPAHPNGGVQVGISDVLQWRDCPARMEFGMRRHEESGDPPESWSPANAYGTAVHLCLSMLDDGATPDECVQAAFELLPQWLEPSDLSRLHEDIEKYLEREMLGVRTLLNEGEISVPLFVHPRVGQVWFRARIDRLVQSMDDPSQLVHIDYKSSKWAKSDEEVSKDIQLWSYNFVIYEWFTDLYPEIDRPQIQQWYDQLRYGQIPTRKSDAQRAEIKRWMIAAITALIDDEAMQPKFNEWCPWCPLKMDCPVVQYQLTHWATVRIAALMPREEKYNKDGSLSKRQGPVVLDRDAIGEYTELLPDVKRARLVLETFEKEVSGTLKEMPASELHRLGKRLDERTRRAFSEAAKREIIAELGLGTFLLLSDLSIAAVERFFGDDKETADRIKALAQKTPGYTVIVDLD